MRKLQLSTIVAMFQCVIVVGLAVVSMRLRSGHVLAVQTASMVPTFAPGDALWIRLGADNLKVGQIVSYRSRIDPRQIVSHRIVRLDAGNQQLTTRGDHLSEPDPSIRNWDVIGRVDYIVPHGGTVLNWLFSWPGLILFIYVPACVVLITEVRRLRLHDQYARYKLREAGSRPRTPSLLYCLYATKEKK